jgi:hypothetical protein
MVAGGAAVQCVPRHQEQHIDVFVLDESATDAVIIIIPRPPPERCCIKGKGACIVRDRMTFVIIFVNIRSTPSSESK